MIMCLFSKPPAPPPPVQPAEYQQQREPDGGMVRDTKGRRVRDRMRAAASTILTSGSGVTSGGMTEQKTLLGA